MKKSHILTALLLIFTSSVSIANDDSRQLIELPEMMQKHMMSNMRDHLAAINEILVHISNDQLDEAAEVAETRLVKGAAGCKKPDMKHTHKKGPMGKFMPDDMRKLGMSMHEAASRFSLKAKEGKVEPALSALSEVTSSCVACHTAYRIR